MSNPGDFVPGACFVYRSSDACMLALPMSEALPVRICDHGSAAAELCDQGSAPADICDHGSAAAELCDQGSAPAENCAHGYATACTNDMSTNPGDFVPGACLAVLCTLHVDIRDQTHALVIGLGGVRISPPLPFRICADLFACCPILVSSVSELVLFWVSSLSELCLVLAANSVLFWVVVQLSQFHVSTRASICTRLAYGAQG